MSYKLCIDMCYFGPEHRGGKDEVAYNLLRGFEKIGVSDQIVCFTYKDLVPVLKEVSRDIKLCIVPHIGAIHRFARLNYRFRSFYEEWWAVRNKIGVILFPNKPTVNRKYRLATIEIPHDIQAFNEIYNRFFDIKHRNKAMRKIVNDFHNRDYLISISDFDRSEMIKYMPWAEKKIVRIYNPIRFSELNRNVEAEKNFITVLNIQWPHKNVETVLKAYAEIVKEIDLKLILVGRYPRNIDELKEYVINNNLSERVSFVGFLNNEELMNVISRTRIYINASLYEGFGMTAIEMMGNKVPTIVAESSAMPEVTMNLCRYYSPPTDSHALAEEIIKEIRTPFTENQLIDISNAVRTRYSFEKSAGEYWNLVNKISCN